MNIEKKKLLRGLQFFSTVIIPVMTLAVTATLTYLKECEEKDKKEEKKKLETSKNEEL